MNRRAAALATAMALVLTACGATTKPAATSPRPVDPYAAASGSIEHPLANVCIGPCPSFDAAYQTIVGSDGVFHRCSAGDPPASVIVERGHCGPFRYLSTAAGFETVADWFDASGALIGELRSGDVAPFAAYGTIPACEPLTTDEMQCRAEGAKGRDGFAPAWRTP